MIDYRKQGRAEEQLSSTAAKDFKITVMISIKDRRDEIAAMDISKRKKI